MSITATHIINLLFMLPLYCINLAFCPSHVCHHWRTTCSWILQHMTKQPETKLQSTTCSTNILWSKSHQYFLAVFVGLLQINWTRDSLFTHYSKNCSSLHQHTLSFLHKHTLNIFVSIYRIILTGGGGSLHWPRECCLPAIVCPLNLAGEASSADRTEFVITLLFGSKAILSFHFSFLFKSWHTANSNKHWVVGVNCSSHVAGLRCADIFTLSKKKSCAYTHIENVAETASFYLNRTYDHHSYYYKPYLNEITGIINHLSTYIYSSPFFNSQNPKQAVLLLLETWDYKYPALIEFNWIVTFKAVFIIHLFFPSSMATFSATRCSLWTHTYKHTHTLRACQITSPAVALFAPCPLQCS